MVGDWGEDIVEVYSWKGGQAFGFFKSLGCYGKRGEEGGARSCSKNEGGGGGQKRGLGGGTIRMEGRVFLV